MHTSVKTCKQCGEPKTLAEFYKHQKMADGHLNKCKPCVRGRVASHRERNVDSIRAYDRARSKLPHRMEKTRSVCAEWRVAQPKRRAAQIAVGNALRIGKLEKWPCMICGEKAEAHHPDYDQPLDVVWLCPAHHKQAHALIRNSNKRLTHNNNWQ